MCEQNPHAKCEEAIRVLAIRCVAYQRMTRDALDVMLRVHDMLASEDTVSVADQLLIDFAFINKKKLEELPDLDILQYLPKGNK